MKWLKPLKPGDSVRCSYRIQEKRVLKSRPDVGASKVLVELLAADDGVIANWVTNQFTRLRSPISTDEQDPSAREAQREAQREAKTQSDLWEGTPPGPLSCKPDLFFEDREVGEIFDLGRHDFSKDNIIAFARAWDPQPFHLDEAAAKASLFGALAASGWHTAALYIRSLVAARQRASGAARAEGIALAAYGPSPGFKNLSWPRPVLVGDTVSTARASPIRSISNRAPTAACSSSIRRAATRRAKSCLASPRKSCASGGSPTEPRRAPKVQG